MNTATIEYVPADENVVVHDTVPPESGMSLQPARATPATEIVTVPCGVPELLEVVAVKVTCVPEGPVTLDALKAIEVGAGFDGAGEETIWMNADEVDDKKLESPE